MIDDSSHALLESSDSEWPDVWEIAHCASVQTFMHQDGGFDLYVYKLIFLLLLLQLRQ